MSPISHTEEFKKRVVYDVVVKKHSLNRAAMDNGVSPQALSGYVKKYGQEVLDEYNRKNGIGQIVTDTRERMAQKPPATERAGETSLSPAGDISPFRGEGSRPEGGAKVSKGRPQSPLAAPEGAETPRPESLAADGLSAARETSLSPAGDISPFRGEGNRPEGAGEGTQGTTGKPARKNQSKPRAVKMTITRVDGHTAGYSLLDDDRIHVELHEQTNAFTEEELLTWAAEITQAVEMLGAKS